MFQTTNQYISMCCKQLVLSENGPWGFFLNVWDAMSPSQQSRSPLSSSRNQTQQTKRKNSWNQLETLWLKHQHNGGLIVQHG